MERRSFIKNSAIMSAGVMLYPGLNTRANSAAPVRVGIIGCGNRGTAVLTAMSKIAGAQVVAMADLFEDKLQMKYPVFNALNMDKKYPAIDKSNLYYGPSAYRNLLSNKDVDAVLISSPAYTHPGFLIAAVEAGKHAYCEKPASIDVEGCKQIAHLGHVINGKRSVAIGFQVRVASAYSEMLKRIRNGDIGDPVTVQLYYLASALPTYTSDEMSYDELRIKNHFHFRESSGGILLDQGVHMLDICNTALQSHPVSAIGRGGRSSDKVFGNAWDNYQVIYQYPKNVQVSFHSTQLGNTWGDVCARFIGTKGIAEAHYSGGVFIDGDNKWDSGVARSSARVTDQQKAAGVFLSALDDADGNKAKSFIDSIQTGKYLNDIPQAVDSTLTAILGRQAAESAREITWDEMNFNNESIDPELNLSQFKDKPNVRTK